MRIKNLRYSRIQFCATPSGYRGPLNLWNRQENCQESRVLVIAKETLQGVLASGFDGIDEPVALAAG